MDASNIRVISSPLFSCYYNSMEQADWAPRVVDLLNTKLFNDPAAVQKFSQILKQHGALIAGGFVLNACMESPPVEVNDMDIYVPIQNVNAFLTDMLEAENHPLIASSTFNEYASSMYCRSFLRRNGIKSVKTITVRRSRDGPRMKMDVMTVRTHRTPLEVVNNFDLTFCQVWYDGEKVYASHPQHIIEKKGMLQGDYVTTLLEGNMFLRTRIKKYMKRGFKISMEKKKSPIILAKQPCARDRTEEEGYQQSIRRAVGRILYPARVPPQMADRPKFLTRLPLQPLLAMKRKETKLKTAHPSLAYDYIIREDNEYDSEDEEAFEAKKSTPEYHRALTTLYVNTFAPAECLTEEQRTLLGEIVGPYEHEYHGSFGMIHSDIMAKELLPDRWKQEFIINVYDPWQKRVTQHLPSGDNMMGEEGTLFCLHDHDEEGLITKDGLKGYLDSLPHDADREEIRCFYHPACTKTLTRIEISGILGPEFCSSFFKTKKVATHPRIRDMVTYYDAALYDTKKFDQHYGWIYTTGMCPFCLQYLQRESDCIYMTHANINREEQHHSPFCPKIIQNEQMYNKYAAAAMQYIRRSADYARAPDHIVREFVHLSTCIECGRPCMNHQHFDEAGIAPVQVAQQRNYGDCMGGHRRELIARMLAVRDVCARGMEDPEQEWNEAIKQAQQAATNEEYLSRADAILQEGIVLEDELDGLRKRLLALPQNHADVAALRRQIQEGEARLVQIVDRRKWDREIPPQANNFSNISSIRSEEENEEQQGGSRGLRAYWAKKKFGGQAPPIPKEFIGVSACAENSNKPNNKPNKSNKNRPLKYTQKNKNKPLKA